MKAEIRDGVEVEWVYYPSDKTKHGKRETLPKDVAALKVKEGLAKYPAPKPALAEESPQTESAGSDEKSAAKRK